MKKASEIISHLFQPSMRTRVVRHKCYRAFVATLPKRLQRAIAFVFVRERMLFVALRHPGFKMEFHYNRDLMKSLLTAYAKHHPECAFDDIRDVAVYTSKYYAPDTPLATSQSVPYYKERADGRFRIDASDEEIAKRFETIQEHIACLKR